jgi:hypothetical protein
VEDWVSHILQPSRKQPPTDPVYATDTSCILAWLIEQGYTCICFMGDVGQEEDFEAAEKKAYAIGAEKFYLVVS